jgi:Leucine-rich repeat (LRR) protein
MDFSFTDDIEGELEKRKCCGVYLTRKVTVPALICIAVSLIIGISVGVTGGGKASKLVESSLGVKEPKDPRYEEFLLKVEPLVGHLITEEGTPQNYAFNWLVYDDPAKLDPAKTPLDSIIQRYALASFYKALGGSTWENSVGFMSEEDVCKWNAVIDGEQYGVSCFDGSTVSKLVFPGNKMNGTLPLDVGLLSGLETLVLKENDIEGWIPHSLGLLTSLITLDLADNKFNGRLPNTISQMTSLQYIYAQRNQLEGLLGNHMTECPYLMEFDVSKLFTMVGTYFENISSQLISSLFCIR